MPPEREKPININDLGLILEVNKKAIEINSEVSEQYETIIQNVGSLNKTVNDANLKVDSLNGKVDKLGESSGSGSKVVIDKLDKINTQNENLSREIFTIKVLFIGVILNLITSIVQLFIKK